MADRKNFSRYKMRCGMLMRSDSCGRKIEEITLPKQGQYTLLLTAKDIPGSNSLPFFSDTREMMASERIAYPGQIICALFAPDYEIAAMQMRTIEAKLSEDESFEEPAMPDMLEYSWGEFTPDEEEKAKLKAVESAFTLSHESHPTNIMYTVTAWRENSKIHIETPCEWVDLIKSAVAAAIMYPKESIVIHQLPHRSRYDEFLINPAIVSAIAAVAVIRTGLPCEIKDMTVFSRPGIEVRRKTITDEDGKPLSETVSMTVDMGASPLIPEEYQRQAMTGLIPPYPLKEFHGSVDIRSSALAPAAFTGSLGYSEALASTEYHISRLAETTEMTPYAYRGNIEKRRFTDYLPGFELEDQKKTMAAAATASTYERKWFANNFQRHSFGILGYIKGIGLASGTGISGFSTTFARAAKFRSMMTYTQKHNVTINTSALNHPNMQKIWRTLISDKINPGHPETVMFLDPSQDTLDAGPDVLSRIISSLTPQLESAARKLAVLKDEEALPVSVIFDAQNTALPCEFQNAGYATVVAEIIINETDFYPTVTAVWADIILPQMLNEASLRNAVKRSILSTIAECGFMIPLDFEMHLGITATGTDTTVSSLASLMKALTIGALSNALYQVAGKEGSMLPTSSSMLEKVLGRSQI